MIHTDEGTNRSRAFNPPSRRSTDYIRKTLFPIGLAICVMQVGCDRSLMTDLEVRGDTAGHMYTVVLDEGRVVSRESSYILTSDLTRQPHTDSTGLIPALDLVQPDDSVSQWIQLCETRRTFCDQRRDVVVAFREFLPLPAFPDPIITEPPDSPSNLERLRLAAGIRDSLVDRHNSHLDNLFHQLGVDASVEEFFWIANATLISIRIGDLTKLLADSTVQYIESRFPDHPQLLPHVSTESDTRPRRATAAAHHQSIPQGAPTVSDGRSVIQSDPYFDLDSLNGMRGWIGLLDTGVRYTHVLLADSGSYESNLRFVRDCTFGIQDCRGANTQESYGVESVERPPYAGDPAECGQYVGHGTASAAVLAGNLSLGNPFRGVTDHVLDFYKIYDCVEGFPQTDTAAFLRALETAITNLDKVILAELPVVPQRFHSIVLVAADRAFDLGAVVIAPVGNTRGQVFAPAFGRRVIASGALEIESGVSNGKKSRLRQFSQQGFGPTPDGRIKPDVQPPTNTWTAGNCLRNPVSCSNNTLIQYQMTSGGAPYAAGAASLLRNFISFGANTSRVDPGHVYAHLILSGQHTFPFPDSVGAGLIRLPPLNGTRYWGMVSLSEGESFDLPVYLSESDSTTLDAALWWPNPEQFLSISAAGNDIDLQILNASGATVAASTAAQNSFERARASAGAQPNEVMTVRMFARRVQTEKQMVYWAVHTSGG